MASLYSEKASVKKMDKNIIIEKTAQCLIKASTTFRADQVKKYKEFIAKEENANAKWVLEKILEDASVAEDKKIPLCDDTGIPHVFVEFGEDIRIDKEIDRAVKEGIKKGLINLPGRPMAVKGDMLERLEQKEGLYEDPEEVAPAPIIYKYFSDKGLRITVMMLGGGPEIRGKTYRVFHKHDKMNIFNQIGEWVKSISGELGCTPCVPAIGIGRTHYEATVLMLEAMKEGDLYKQSEFEKMITNITNECKVGPLGLGGNTTALGSFIKIGPQRASGVRIVCMRPGCCFDPRRATTVINFDSR